MTAPLTAIGPQYAQDPDRNGDASVLVDPRTGAPRGRFPVADAAVIEDTVAAARQAQPGWGGRSPGGRATALLRLADRLEQRAEAYARAERAGTGKPDVDAVAEVGTAVDVLRFYAGAARTELTPAGGRRMPGHESWVRWEPLGVVAAVVPWNYPLLMAMWRVAPALAAGNTVVLKPAETTPDTALLLEADAADVLGASVLRTVTGGRRTGQLLVESTVDAIAFTGSAVGGADVVARAGLRRTSLELGGNCPAIVLPDASDETCAALVAASVYNAGQSCAAPARVITLRDNYQRTVEGLAAAMAGLRAGRDFGPLNNADQAERFDRILAASAAGIRHVAQPELGPDLVDGYWRAGQILADLPEDDPAVTEEVFGPVLTVQAASDVDDAVRLANSMPQALAASVWGTDAAQLLGLAGRLDAGEAWVNCHLVQTPELPHGGRRGSGHGTDLSVLALTEYQRPKCVTVRLR